jgi:enamine deaminase RidA (YjgF/YER057c/UK114 family)
MIGSVQDEHRLQHLRVSMDRVHAILFMSMPQRQAPEPTPMPQFLHPKTWAAAKGFANGVAAEGRQVFVAGQVGWTGAQEFASDDFVAQTEQALRNIVAVLAEAGAAPEHLVRLTWYVTDKREYVSRLREVGEAYRRVLGRHYPAMTLVQVVALVEDRAKVEIEATAVVPSVGS